MSSVESNIKVAIVISSCDAFCDCWAPFIYSIKKYYGKIDNELKPLYDKYDKESVWKVINRHLNSEFKRNHPYKIVIK